MMTFRYKAVSLDGVKVSGVIKAYNEFEAVAELRKSCSVVTRITEVKDSEKPKELFPSKIKEKDLAMVCSQFSIVLHSGLPMVQAIKMVSEQVAAKELREILMKTVGDVDSGFTLAQGLERNGGDKLPITFIETIRAGEEAGTLDQSFERLEKYYDKQAKSKGKVFSALLYPAIVIFVAIAVFIIIMTVAVPLFVSTFEDMGVDIPVITQIMIAMSNFILNWWWLVLAVILVAFIAFKIWVSKPEGRMKFDTWKLTKAPLHKITLMGANSEFAATMATMMSAGLNLVGVLDVCSQVVNNVRFGQAVKNIRDGVEKGRHVADCMREDPVFPSMMAEMTGVGEESGTIEHTLAVVGEYYTNEADMITNRLLTIMQPVLTCGLAAITVFLLLGVYLPMFGMYGNIQ